MEQQLMIGDRVMVYEDPYTGEKEEGSATIAGRMEDFGDRWYCKVRFDNEPENTYQRFIIKPGWEKP